MLKQAARVTIILCLLLAVPADEVPSTAHLLKAVEALLSKDSNSTLANVMPPVLNFDLVNLLRWLVQVEKENRAEKYGHSYGQLSFDKNSLDLVTLGGKKYFFSTREIMNYVEAQSFCRIYGMNLVSVETKEENDLIANHIEKIGSSHFGMFISAHRIGTSEFKWIYGDLVKYANWLEECQTSKGNCVTFWKGKWCQDDCIIRNGAPFTRRFICEES